MTLTHHAPPAGEAPEADRSSHRWAGAGALAAAAVGLIAVTALIERPHRSGASDSAPGRTRRGLARFGKHDVVGRTVTINRPRADVYAVFKDPAQLARFMENIHKVKRTGDTRAVWTIAGPAGVNFDVETEIVTDRENEEIAWRSVEGSEIETRGKILLRDAPAGRGTEVEAVIAYKAPFGEIGRAIAALFQKEPAIQGRRDLKRLKMLMETGEIAISRNHRPTSQGD
ncbi:SRPBCC family protein [Acuticoccus yangtzensis]|uniref:SRPBCC family protein n=1 Tax=Acuticoccus yangtzensis TaxID=1443441 RepID=UPI0009497374|nr:SRPBCC family protein [Acuticoccus yangtzensis]ORE91381.1 cyclase/dehydrase [Stappia sp. 22II-S9-Z10]